MTKQRLRDKFAMAALTGISSNIEVVQEAMRRYAPARQGPTIPAYLLLPPSSKCQLAARTPEDCEDDFQFHMMAVWAYKQADAMMELRNL